MTSGSGPNPAPRAGRALPAKWQLAVAAVAAFLIYGVVSYALEWTGWRARPEPDPGLAKGARAIESVATLEAKLGAALRELAQGDDDQKREKLDKLARDYVRVRHAAQEELKKKPVEESEIGKEERKRREQEEYDRVWRELKKLVEDPRKSHGEIAEFLAKNISAFPHDTAQYAVEQFSRRTKQQSGMQREMTVLAKEIERLLTELPAAVDGGSKWEAENRIKERIRAYYAARHKLGLPMLVAGERELEVVSVMPYESGVQVLVRNLGVAEQARIMNAFSALRLDLRSGEMKGKQPLFKELPRVPEYKVEGASETARDDARRFRKWELQKVIDVVYRDCDEAYRVRYLGFMKELVRDYMGMGRVVESVPDTEYYPEFLLGEGATANEQMQGARAILFSGTFTRSAQAKLTALPERLLGKACPAERLAYATPKAPSLPRLSSLGVVPADVGKLPSERVPAEAVRALELALQECEPRTRHVFAGHIAEFVRVAMRGKPRRRGAAAGDEAIAVQLGSMSRAEMAAGLKRVLLLGDITDEMAGRAQAAAVRLFREQCPGSSYATQLEAYRAAEAEAAKRAAEYAAERAKRK